MIKALMTALLVPFTAAASTPPVITVGSAGADRTLVSWLPGEVRCSGAILVPQLLENPLASLAWGSQLHAGSVSYVFDIAPDGRTSGIRKLGKDPRATGSEEIAPSLAATRFAPGSGYTGCTIAYVARQTRLDVAPIADLTAYSVNSISGRLPQEAWDRMYGNSDCRDERSLGLKARNFPDFHSIPATPGVRQWSMVGYDINADGVTANIETVAGTGNSALDLASRTAVAETRFYAGGRKGCRFPYWRSPATLPAPSIPDESAFRSAGATCPDRHEWAVRPALRFSEPYRRRAIEGWAIVTYDVAPWGEIANVQVAASQPTEDFGNQAITIVRGAKAATTQGFVGCVERVKFVMGSDKGETR